MWLVGRAAFKRGPGPTVFGGKAPPPEGAAQRGPRRPGASTGLGGLPIAFLNKCFNYSNSALSHLELFLSYQIDLSKVD